MQHWSIGKRYEFPDYIINPLGRLSCLVRHEIPTRRPRNFGLGIEVEVVGQDPEKKGKGFQVRPRRWVVERTNAWVSRRRRCARDYERLPDHHAAMVQIAAIIQMTRRLARARAAAAAA